MLFIIHLYLDVINKPLYCGEDLIGTGLTDCRHTHRDTAVGLAMEYRGCGLGGGRGPVRAGTVHTTCEQLKLKVKLAAAIHSKAGTLIQ